MSRLSQEDRGTHCRLAMLLAALAGTAENSSASEGLDDTPVTACVGVSRAF